MTFPVGKGVLRLGRREKVTISEEVPSFFPHAYPAGPVMRPLTELPNRRAAEQRLEAALRTADRSGSSLGVVFIAIDGFKDLNSSFGDPIGNAVLYDVATRLRELARSSDLITRYGSDEFVAFYPAIADTAELSDAVYRLQGAFDQPFDVNGRLFELSASIGIARYPQDATAASDLIARANAAMQQAQGERSKVCWSNATLGEALCARRELLERLNDPFTQRELFLRFQPILDVSTERIIAAEALLRWQHPILGVLDASEILQVVGRLPASIEIWVIAEAISRLAALRDAEASLRVSVNLSNFDDRTFNSIVESLRTAGVDSRSIMIEIPEHAVAPDPASAIAFGRKCSDHGIDVVLDAFMGKMNIFELGRLPISAVKLAPALIAEIQPHENSIQPFLLAAINVARSFGFSVIATSVESTAQQRWLQNVRVNLMQGRGIVAPFTYDELSGLVCSKEVLVQA